MRARYLGTERRVSGGAGGGGELVGELRAESGQDTAVGRPAAEGGGGSQPPQEHGARRDGMQNCGSIRSRFAGATRPICKGCTVYIQSYTKNIFFI